MKILYVSTISNTINAFMIPHIELLLDKGNHVDVACNIQREINPRLLERNCKVYNIEFQRSPLNKHNYNAYKKVKRLIQDEKYDLVHVHTPVASFLTRMACRKIPNLKILYTAHGFHFFKGSPLKNWLMYYPIERLAARWTDVLITMNEEDYSIARKFKIRDGGSVYKVHGVGIDLNRFQPQTLEKKMKVRKDYGYKKEDFILFYAAELNFNKHQDLLIKVVNILKNNIPNIKLLLAGNGPLEGQYKRQVEQLNLGRYVDFLGYRNDIPSLLAMSDVVVASSRREGLPVNIMEAMATGLPLVVTNIRGHRDLVRNGENGYIVELNNVEGFAKSIENLYKNEKLRERFGQKSIELIQQYSLESILKELKMIYIKFLR